MLRDGSSAGEASWSEGQAAAGGGAVWCGSEGEVDHEQRCAKVHRRLKRIVKARGALDVQEAEALREAERLRVWRHYGYSSLLEYMEMEMGYTPRVALERLRVAKAIEELPVIAQKMEQGDLSFSAARELTRVATAETEDQWLEAANDKNVRQVEDLVSGHQRGDAPSDPVDPKLRTCRLRYDDIDPETKAMLRQARQILEREHGERFDDNEFLRALARTIIDGAGAPERDRPAHQIAVTVCEQCRRGWQDGGGITVEMSPARVEAALCDAQHIGPVDEAAMMSPAAGLYPRGDSAPPAAGSYPRGYGESSVATVTPEPARSDTPAAKAPSAPRPHRAHSDIPPAVRRAVRARDHGRCRVTWCRSSRNVDAHHIRPRSEGGTHTLDNLISLCESHHLAHHAGGLLIEGNATNPTFTRRAHNSFAIAERAVETTRALRALGFDKREVKAAMDKTRTHVGNSELTLEQWIKIALSYCPKPTA